MIEESADGLPPLFFRTDHLASRGQLQRTPPRDRLIKRLKAAGFEAARSHVDDRGVKTSAGVREVLQVAAGL